VRGPAPWPPRARALRSGPDFMAPGTARSAPSGPRTFTFGSPDTDRESLLLPGASGACSYCRGSVRLRTGTRSCAVHKEQQLTWLGLKGRLEQTHLGLLSVHPQATAPPLQPPGRRQQPIPGAEGGAGRPGSRSGAPPSSDPVAVCLKIGSLT